LRVFFGEMELRHRGDKSGYEKECKDDLVLLLSYVDALSIPRVPECLFHRRNWFPHATPSPLVSVSPP
jgi:hypothetical protein